jgi:hypothetical protein
MSAFLMVFDKSQVERDAITKKIDKIPTVRDWYAFLSNTICLISDKDARALSKVFRGTFPDVRFIIVEIDPEKRGGWLPKSVWEFIRKAHSQESSAA